jgi:hypothetical protein
LLEGKPPFVLLHLLLDGARVAIHDDAELPVELASAIESADILAPHGGAAEGIEARLDPIEVHAGGDGEAFDSDSMLAAGIGAREGSRPELLPEPRPTFPDEGSEADRVGSQARI